MSQRSNLNPYVELLGIDFLALPANVQKAHTEHLEAVGTFCVCRPESRALRLLGNLLRLPRAGGCVPVHLRVSKTADGRVRWERHIGELHICSTQRARSGLLVEQFTGVSFRFRVAAEAGQLVYRQRACHVFGIPVPRLFAPRIDASVGETESGWRVRVEFRWPFETLLCTYEGEMAPT